MTVRTYMLNTSILLQQPNNATPYNINKGNTEKNNIFKNNFQIRANDSSLPVTENPLVPYYSLFHYASLRWLILIGQCVVSLVWLAESHVNYLKQRIMGTNLLLRIQPSHVSLALAGAAAVVEYWSIVIKNCDCNRPYFNFLMFHFSKN